jgi:hypothetical protein
LRSAILVDLRNLLVLREGGRGQDYKKKQQAAHRKTPCQKKE